jgi:competence protein ComEC
LWVGAALAGFYSPITFICLGLLFLFLLYLRISWILLLASFAAVALLSLHRYSLTHNAFARDLQNKPTLLIDGDVRSDPTWSSERIIGSRMHPRQMTFLISTRSPHLPLRVVSKNGTTANVGSHIRFYAQLLPTVDKRVVALALVRGEITVVSKGHWIYQIAAEIRSRFRDESERIRGDGGRLLPGLILGDTSRETPLFITQMRRAGLTHLTAVSGENFAIIAGFLLWITQWIFRRYRLRIIFTAIFLAAFIILVRPSPSVLRASVMSAVLLLARATGRRVSPLASLGAAVALLITLDPFQGRDPGFALSVAATAGILLLSDRIPLPNFLAIPISATFICTPIIIAISGQLSLISILANVLVAPAIAPITVVGVTAALIPHSWLTHFLLILCNPSAEWVVLVARYSSKVPTLLLPGGLLGSTIIVALTTLYFFRRTFLLLLIPILILFQIKESRWPGADWMVIACDVGQGDGLLLNLHHHAALVIDTGPDPVAMDRCLKSAHITTVPLLVLTHFHADHVGGLQGVLHGRTVREVWITTSQQPFHEYEVTMNSIKEIPHTVVSAGERAILGDVKLHILWPNKDEEKLPSMPGDGSAINNTSLVLDIQDSGQHLLFLGDAEPPSQAAIAHLYHLSPVDILKVAHHGSAYQDGEWLATLHPRISLISVGVGNSYGHPSPSTIALLQSLGSRVLRTDRDGAISLSTDAGSIRLKKRAWWSWG